MKKVISLVLSVVILLSTCLVAVYAQPQEKELKILCYNVAGLPDFSAFVGSDPRNVTENQKAIGKYVKENNIDIFATQEDFFFHKYLTCNLGDEYNYYTAHHGGVPWGDGTNIFTKDMKLYNEQHIPFDKMYGILNDGADQFSKKGITYCCIEIEDGVYIDFYDIHADAYDDTGSREARSDNFRQLAELIKNRAVDRPVIVTGDFNAYYFNWTTNSGVYNELIGECGLKDAWIELYNNGDYNSADYYASQYGGDPGAKWGRWDSVERFLYKGGDGIELDCTSFEYVSACLEDGTNCSDHNAASGVFTYKVTDKSKISSDGLEVVKSNIVSEIFRRISAFIDALKLIRDNFGEIISFFNGNNSYVN